MPVSFSMRSKAVPQIGLQMSDDVLASSGNGACPTSRAGRMTAQVPYVFARSSRKAASRTRP